jgi:hypothetical protein
MWRDEKFGQRLGPFREKLHELPRLPGGATQGFAATCEKVQGRTNMLLNTDKSLGRWDCGAPEGQKRIGDKSLTALLDRLRHLEFEVPPFYGPGNNTAGGVPTWIAVRKLLRTAAGTGTAVNAIRALLGEDTPFTLSLSDLGNGDAAIDAMQRFCEFLRAEIANSGRSGEHVGICIHARQLSLQAFQVVTDTVPGTGPRYVLLHSSQMTAHGDRRLQSDTDRNWSFLWRNRMASAPLKPAYGAVVKTACPLLADEVATSILPVHGIQVPADSAWLPASLALPQFADASGEIGWDRLTRALAGGVGLLDEIMDRLHWSQADHRSDARLNRRLGISISGLGDLVLRRGLDPQDLDALRWLSAIIMRIRKILWHCSGEMAHRHGYLPALCSSDPSRGWDDSAHREAWRHHWRVAVEESAVRHRNMLALSPYAVLPSGDACNAAYTDLLPVIACADAWSFADASRTRSFSLSDYKTFHRRAWAIIHGRKTGTLIAAGV